MSRSIWKYDPEQGKVVELGSEWTEKGPEAKDLFTSDTMDPTTSMITGKTYTSRSAIRREYKEHKRDEIGNDKFPDAKPPERPPAESHIREAIRQLKWGEAPLTEYDRHRCEIINHNLKHYNYDRRRRD